MDTHQQKISHLKALYKLAHADKDFSKAEAVFIRNVAERLGVDLKDFDSLRVEKEQMDMELPDREYKIYALYHRLVMIIMVDNVVTEEEKKYCFNLGLQMGLHPNALAEVLDYIIKKGALVAMPSEIVAIFRKYSS